MENLESTQPTQTEEQGDSKNKLGPLIMFIVTFVLVVIALWQFSGGKTEKRPIESSEFFKEEETEKVIPPTPVVEEQQIVEPVLETPAIEEVELVVQEVVEKEIIVPLPALDESDSWIQEKLPEITWRNELLTLLITEDMVRRFVVFTDNFSQGLVAYEHSPFVQPTIKFKVDEQSAGAVQQNVWPWDSSTSKRFDLYVDLLRSVDSTTLVSWYFEVKPLIDEAYSELGYEENFTYTLQGAITRVLDMELPKSSMAVTRTSVMYKYQDEELEALADSDKLLLRIGKENLLIIKSVLLEINEKLTQQAKTKS